MIRLIVGLGNPGPEYAATRHNAGYWLIDRIAQDLNTTFSLKKSFQGWVAIAKFCADHHARENVVLLKPTTYMNRSWQSVEAAVQFYKFKPTQLLVLHDELDLMPGQVKLKQGGGHAGHNGLRGLPNALGSADFWRLRIGIGHPRTLGLAQPVADFVLHPPRHDELTLVEESINRCRAVLPQLLAGEFDQATRQLHSANAS